MSKNWYVITGAPSSGKSTIIRELAKLGYKTFEEVGRKLIDEAMANGKTLEDIKVDSPEFELAFVEAQHNLESKLNKEETIIFDRGVLDTLPFFEYYGWQIPKQIEDYCAQASYNKNVFLFELLEYDKDYARVETEDIVKKLQSLFGHAYAKAGYNLIHIPKDTVANRLALVRKYIT